MHYKHHKLYATGGFQVKRIQLDGQFEGIQDELTGQGPWINITSRHEHVPKVERYINTVKEWVRFIYYTLPFQKLPGRMTEEMEYSTVFWLNSFPNQKGISKSISPKRMRTGQDVNYKRYCTLGFVSYDQVHEQHNNDMETRTAGGKYTRGGDYFFSLTTGRILNRSHWTKLPMPAEVITRVHEMPVGELERKKALNFMTIRH